LAGAGKEVRLIDRRLMPQRRLAAILAVMLFGVAPADAHGGEMSQKTVATLLRQANGSNPAARLAATKKLFQLGPAIAPQLEHAGAKPMRTVSAPRGDVIYSLLHGELDQAGAAPDSFGLHVDGNVSAHDIERMGLAHGFRLPPQSNCRPELSPACYVQLLPGRHLADVLRNLLTTEARVTTVNLNYIER